MSEAPPRSWLDAAREGGPWSLGSVVFGDEDLVDDEGRPLKERRAPMRLRAGVPMEMVACPYHDERHGQFMNASALEQLERLLPTVAARVVAFRAMLPAGGEGWGEMLTTLMDLLTAPAAGLLGARAAGKQVPAVHAAGFKLAIGYFDALRRLLALELRGRLTAPTADAFMAYVHEARVLIGAGEVCGGPPQQIAGLSRLLLGPCRRGAAPDAARVAVAAGLATQVRLGLAWERLDDVAERRLLALLDGEGAAQPRTSIVEARLAERRAAHAHERAPVASQVARALDLGGAPAADALGAAVAQWEASACAEPSTLAAVGATLAHREGGLTFTGEGAAVVARDVAELLTVYRAFVAAQAGLERTLRRALGREEAAPVALHPAVLPRSRALELAELALGHTVECAVTDAPRLSARNHRRHVPLLPPAPA